MTALTINTKYIHFAVARESTDGEYVVMVTHVPWIVNQVMQTWQREEREPDEVAYAAASEAEREAWVYAPTMRVYVYEAGQEVWLGFPFEHCGAKEFDGQFLQVSKGYREDGTPIVGDCAGADEVRDIMSRARSGNWLD